MATTILTRALNGPQAIWKYMQESYVELRKVSWPTRETTIRYTIIVAASSLLVGAVIGGVDFLLTFALEKIIL